MKKIIITLFSVLPFLALSQSMFSPGMVESGKLSVGFSYGSVYDIDLPKFDIDPNSPDVSSGQKDARYSYLASLNYEVSPSLSIGANWGRGSIFGANDVVEYVGEYSQYNLSTKLNLFKLNDKFITYGRLGFGVISYNSTLYIDTDYEINNREADALKSNIALGAEYSIDHHWAVNFDASYERVADNGFDADSWNLGTGSDVFLHTSIGINYTIGNVAASNDDVRFEKMKQTLTAANTICKEECNKVNSILDQLEQRISELELQKITLENKDFKAANTITESLRSRLFFKADSDVIEVTAFPSLDDLISYMKKYPSWTAHLIGYSDSDASDAHNNKLSRKRAEVVVNYLKSNGVESFRLTMDYKGESAPFVPNSSENNKQLNRRVEIIITK
jgi:outer membrane protein OmpA-like peptidoglycan-associated protein